MIENYGFSDVLWQLIRISLLGSLCTLGAFGFTEFIERVWLAYLAGIFAGGLVYVTIMTLFDLLMYYVAGCEALGPFDAIFLLDDK